MKIKLIIGFLSINFLVFSQGTQFSHNPEIHSIVQRLAIAHPEAFQNLLIATKNISKFELYQSIKSISNLDSILSPTDYLYLRGELEEFDSTFQTRSFPIKKPNWLFPSHANMFTINVPDFYMRINPILSIQMGKDNLAEKPIYQNTRGVEIQGSIVKNVGFYFQFTENLQRFNTYEQLYANGFFRQGYYKFIPGNGYWKEFGAGGNDFSNVIGYMDFRLGNYFSASIGHDRHTFGYGYRSLFLSDIGAPAFFIKAQANVWKLNYHVLINQYINQYIRGVDRLLPRKYAVSHLLSFRPSKKIEIGLWENVVYNRGSGLDIQYFNPVMFYRSLEHSLGSSDNSLIGLQGKYTIKKNASVYAQLILDDLNIKEFLSNSGWWGNKWGVQIGGNYINALGIKNLDIQSEFNLVRPFTYSHYNISFSGDTVANLTHYNQPLAHPLGANFSEWILAARYQPIKNLRLQLKYILSNRGLDSAGILMGSNILAPTNTNQIIDPYGATQNRGIHNTVHLLSLHTQYMIWHNLFLDLDVIYRKSKGVQQSLNTNQWIVSGGLRWNFGRRERYF